jgi:hypothetical protein
MNPYGPGLSRSAGRHKGGPYDDPAARQSR